MTIPHRALLFAAALAIGLASDGRSADLRSVLTDFTLTSWSAKDGLPAGTVLALAQDSDGYLWVGNTAGLFRFDGVRFIDGNTIAQDSLPTAPVRALWLARDGSLWIGFGGAGGVGRLRGHRYISSAGVPPGVQINSLIEDADGAIWAATARGVYRSDSNRDRFAPVDGLEQAAAHAIYVDVQRRLFVGTDTALFQYDAQRRRFAQLRVFGNIVRAIAEDADGVLWVSNAITGLQPAGTLQPSFAPDVRGRGIRLLKDRRGQLWIGTGGQGLWRTGGAARSRTIAVEKATSLTGLLADGVYAILEDRDGNIWAGTTEGLNRLTPRKITQIIDVGLVRGVETTAHGSVWVGTVDGLVEYAPEGTPVRRRLEPVGSAMSALHLDERGVLWAATEHELIRLAGGRRTSVPLSRDSAPGHVEWITSTGPSGLWLYDRDNGVLHWNGRVLAPAALPSQLRGHRFTAAHTDRSGRLWLASDTGVVTAFTTDGAYEMYGAPDGGTGRSYTAIHEDLDGVIWFGGTAGLARFASSFVALPKEYGLPVDTITSIVTEDDRSLWLGTSSGIAHLDRSEFERARTERSPVRFSLYQRSDGVAGTPFGNGSSSRGAIRARDGRLWFVTTRGVTIIDPGALKNGQPPAPIRIEGIVSDEGKLALSPPATLPPRTRRVQIEYSVVDLTSPLQSRFRYRLDGFDSSWIEAGTRRQAFYTNLRPDTYRFVVEADDGDGHWRPGGASWAFAIQPAFYQTTWFAAICAGIAALGVWAAWRLRVRALRQQFAMLVSERARLSRELHDTLLQSLVGVALQFKAVAKEVEQSAPGLKEHFVRMRMEVEEYIREARRSIWDLRSPSLETRTLADVLRHAGERATAGTAVSFRLRVVGDVRRYPARIEEQVLRIGQEAILNAVRHARATHIDVQLECRDASLRLSVCDDGCGFDFRHDEPAGHYGLTSMKERAAAIGAAFDIASSAGRGTKVTAVVPVAA